MFDDIDLRFMFLFLQDQNQINWGISSENPLFGCIYSENCRSSLNISLITTFFYMDGPVAVYFLFARHQAEHHDQNR